MMSESITVNKKGNNSSSQRKYALYFVTWNEFWVQTIND